MLHGISVGLDTPTASQPAKCTIETQATDPIQIILGYLKYAAAQVAATKVSGRALVKDNVAECRPRGHRRTVNDPILSEESSYGVKTVWRLLFKGGVEGLGRPP